MSHVLLSSVIVLTFHTAQGALTSDVFGWHPWWRWADWWGPLAEWDPRACPPQSSCGPSAWSWPGMGRCSPAMLGTLNTAKHYLVKSAATIQFIHLIGWTTHPKFWALYGNFHTHKVTRFFCGILSVKNNYILESQYGHLSRNNDPVT